MIILELHNLAKPVAIPVFDRFEESHEGRGSRFVPVDTLDHPTHRTWTLWSHRWTPARPGRYRLRLEVDGAHRTRRLDAGYYARDVQVEEVA